MAWGRNTCMRSHMCAAMASSSCAPGSCPSVAYDHSVFATYSGEPLHEWKSQSRCNQHI